MSPLYYIAYIDLLAFLQSSNQFEPTKTIFFSENLTDFFREKSANRVFQGWQEAPISFAPTYKYDYGTDTYDSSEKARIPAWCDRVLWQRESDQSGANILDSGICVFYDRYEIKTSDHRPVVALIDVSVPKVNEELLEEVIAEEIQRQTLTSGLSCKIVKKL